MFRSILLCAHRGQHASLGPRLTAALTAGLIVVNANALPDHGTNQADQPRDRVTQTLRTARERVLTRITDLAEPAERADAWGGLGMLYHAQNRLGEAAEHYRRALDEAETIHWHYLLSVVLTDQGDVAGAAAGFRRALELAEGRHMLASYRLGLALLADGQHEAAAAALRGALGEAPEAAAVLTALGDAELGAGNLDAAREVLEQAARLAPGAGRIAYKLALVYRQLGDIARAEDWLERRNDLAPAIDDPLLLEVVALNLSPRFFMEAGTRAWQRGERDEALAAWRRAAQLAPGDAEVGLTLAHGLGTLGHRDDADAEIHRVLSLHPASARGWYLLAWNARDNNHDAAREAVERSLGLAEDETARALSAALWMRQAHFRAAADDYQGLIDRRPENAYYRYWLAMAYLGAASCEAARPVMAEALRLQPTWGQAHVALTRADALCGDEAVRQAAVGKARRLVDLEDVADTRITLALALAAVGRTDDARAIVASHQVNPDAAMLEAAIAEHGQAAIDRLVRPFAEDSPWWLPAELSPGHGEPSVD
ncbi:MAG: tetratricopeptide repeat protein [Gammaproteobacteria bacterium]|nr:tetratricopeptide repeat protein [Gammaproteobacteria bacterium]